VVVVAGGFVAGSQRRLAEARTFAVGSSSLHHCRSQVKGMVGIGDELQIEKRDRTLCRQHQWQALQLQPQSRSPSISLSFDSEQDQLGAAVALEKQAEAGCACKMSAVDTSVVEGHTAAAAAVARRGKGVQQQ